MEKYIEKQICIDYYDYEFELDEEDCFGIFRDSLQEWVEYADTSEVAEATGVETFPNVKPYNRWSEADFFEDWLVKTFGNRETRDAGEVVHEFLGNWAETNGFERPEKNWNDADWVADWVTQFMGEPKQKPCCSNCKHLFEGVCLEHSVDQIDVKKFGAVGDISAKFVPQNQDEQVCGCWEEMEQ